MATEIPNQLPKPDDIEMAKQYGALFMKNLLKVKKIDLSNEPDGVQQCFTLWGEKVGSQMFNENSPWTIDELLRRINSYVKAHKAT